MTLRQLADLAGTSHSTLSAYEAGRVSPSARTLDRIAVAAGGTLDYEFTRRASDTTGARGRELVDVLELAAMFPARHEPRLTAPVFGRR